MPRRSSSVNKIKGLFSKSRRDEPTPPTRESPLTRESTSYELVEQTPAMKSSRRGRSPPRRTSNFRVSISPPSHRDNHHHDRYPPSPSHHRHKEEPGMTASWSSPLRSSTGRYPPSSSPNYRPQTTRRTSSAHQRPPVASHRHRPPSSESHGTRPHHSPAKPVREPNSLEGFLSGFPTSLATYAGIRALSDHADKAKEWTEWLKNVNNAPDEIKLLSARVTTARDTIQQMQDSLEARPDLIEDEAGQALKPQIEDAIDSTSETLKKMTKLLSSFAGAAEQDGTALGRLEGFWHSYNYKREGEEQVKAADAELQQQLTELSTLMSNIYARALKNKPGIASPTATAPDVPPPTQLTAARRPQEATSGTNISNAASKSTSETCKSTQKETTSDNVPLPRQSVAATPNGPSISPHPIGKVEEDIVTPPNSAQSESLSNQDPRDILLDAAWDGDLKAVAKALRQAPPKSRDPRSLTPLHLAAERDHLAVAMLLLDRGADVHARADGGCTALHLAARYASAATVEMLVERGGADPDGRTSDGRTALHYAAKSAADGDEERRDVIRTLRDLGADPTLLSRKGETPGDVAQKRDCWDAAATLRRAEKKWEEEHRPNQTQRGNWLQRHGFMK